VDGNRFDLKKVQENARMNLINGEELEQEVSKKRLELYGLPFMPYPLPI
jgi:hypothetical protein